MSYKKIMGNSLTVVIILLNIFSILLSAKMLSGFEKTKIAGYILIGEIVNFIICNIIYAFTGNGIPVEVHETSKWMILFTILPINIMILFCPLAYLINKKYFDEISSENYSKKMIILVFLAIIIIIAEIIYIKNIQLGITNFSN